ncbi:MAG: thioesterase family protein [Solirubrobacterales bacterium]|nr:thioesterase family protein [Solirubrobacterales bacterium]
MIPEAVFVRDGMGFAATELALGPWAPGALHGGAPAALLAREFVDFAQGAPLRPARITYEFIRPVMLGPLSARIEVVRPGRRVTLLDGFLRDGDGVEVTRARALLLAPAPLSAGELEPPPFLGPQDGEPTDWSFPTPMFATHAMEIRLVEGALRRPGPAVAWFRLRQPVIAGEAPAGIERIAAAGDFGNGIGSELSWEDHSFINADLTLSVQRDPVDEWVALQSRMRVVQGSVAVAESVLWDREGRIGHALQSLLVAREDRGADAGSGGPPISGGRP